VRSGYTSSRFGELKKLTHHGGGCDFSASSGSCTVPGASTACNDDVAPVAKQATCLCHTGAIDSSASEASVSSLWGAIVLCQFVR